MHRQEIFESDSISYLAFPEQDIIQSIRIAVFDDTITEVHVSAIFSQSGQFTLQLSSDKEYLLTFVYTGSLWLKSRSDKAFGFLKLRYTPNKYFKYVDREWKLSKNCYTTPIERKGIHTLYVQGIKLPETQVLQLRTGGQIETRWKAISDSIILDIGRSKQCTQGYYEPPKSTQYYISNVNGHSVKELNIRSSDSTIDILGPVPISADVYALYIKTLKGFPICPQWSDSIYKQPYLRKLSYLESTGTQYIDTGVTPLKDTVVEIDCDFTASLSALHVLFGARDVSGSNYNAYIVWHDTAQGQPRFDYGNEFGASGQSSVTFPITNFRKEGAKNYVNGALVSENTAVSGITCNNTCRLFAAAGLTYTAKIKVKRCRIWQDGATLTRDFIPVLDKSGVPCMYDRCTQDFFYNAGTGTFNYA